MLTVGASSTCAPLRRASTPMRLPDLVHELGVPRRAERGAARERSPTAVPTTVRRARRSGPSVTFSGGTPRRGTPRSVPEVDAGDHRRLLVEGQLADELIDPGVHGGILA